MQNLVRLGSSFARFAGAVKAPLMTSRTTQVRNFSAYVFDIDSVETFTEKVIQSPVPVIVDFHAEWCGPCHALGPRLEEKVNGRNGRVYLAKVNVDHAGELAIDYGISAVPTVFAFINGEKTGGFTGVLDDEQLDVFIDEILAQ